MKKSSIVGRLIGYLLLYAATLALLGCDGVVQLQGSILSVSGETVADDCVASLYLAADNKKLGHRPFDAGDFFVSFAVLPKKRDYYVQVICPGYSTFRSSVFTSSGKLGEPHQLGEIRLQAKRPSTQEPSKAADGEGNES